MNKKIKKAKKELPLREASSYNALKGKDVKSSGLNIPVYAWFGLIALPLLLGVLLSVFGRSQAPETPVSSSQPASVEAEACTTQEAVGITLNSGMIQQLKALNLPIRVLPPGSVKTMDYDPKRINFDVDENNVVVRAWCG